MDPVASCAIVEQIYMFTTATIKRCGVKVAGATWGSYAISTIMSIMEHYQNRIYTGSREQWTFAMPQFRKLHSKISDSFDLNDMPDDFHRLLWTWLPLALCKEGRGIYHGGWIKSKVMPLREDKTTQDIIDVMEYFARTGLIVKYDVSGREYFYVPTWHKHQNTKRDGASQHPCPVDMSDDSRAGHEEVASGSSLEEIREDKKREEAEYKKDPFAFIQKAIETITGLPSEGKASIDVIDTLVKYKATKADIQAGYEWLIDNGKKVSWHSQLVGPTKTAMSKRMGETNKKKRSDESMKGYTPA